VYNTRVIRYLVDYADELEQEFEQMSDAQFAVVDVFLGALAHDPTMREWLSRDRFQHHPDPKFDTAPIGEALKLGYNLSRVKLWQTDGTVLPFRLIYTLHHTPQACKILFLGLMARGDDYDQHSTFGTDVRQRYDDLGVPKVAPH